MPANIYGTDISNYPNVPQDESFWYNLQMGLNTLYNTAAGYIELEQKQKLSNVLTNPGTAAGSIYTSGIAYQSFDKFNFVVILVFIVLLVWILSK